MSDGKGGSGEAVADSGLSQFIARVLGQLTLGAWLPAAFLVTVGAVVVQFSIQGSVNLGGAISGLLTDKLAFVILVVPAMVLATLITQAFSFESIRLLEGYWPVAGQRMISRHLRRKHSLHEQRLTLSHRAFVASRAAWLRRGFSGQVANALEKASLDLDDTAELALLTEEELTKFEHLNWRSKCSPSEMAIIDALSRSEEEYPADHRVLPTRLGNLMRATEDRLHGAGNDLEGFALRRREHASRRVQLQHDQFRTRLDMYCTLFFVSLLLSAFSTIVLGWSAVNRPTWVPVDTASSAAIILGLLLLVWASYLAAIASARGYLTALVLMDEPDPEVTQSAGHNQDRSS